MKKLIVFLGIILMISVELSNCHAGQDNWGNQRPTLWRTSYTITSEGFANLTRTSSAAAAILHQVVIDSPTLNAASSYISFFNSTTTNTSLYSFTTAAFVNTGINQYQGAAPSSGSVMSPLNQTPPWDIVFTSGIVYNKQGGANLNIQWDYLVPISTTVGMP